MPPDSPPDVAAVSDDDSNANSSSYDELSKSEGGTVPDPPNVVHCNSHDCDSVGLNVIELDSDSSPPVIASEGGHHNHHESPLAKF